MVHALVLALAVVGHGALATLAEHAQAQAPRVRGAAQAPDTLRRAQVPTGPMPDLVGMTLADAERHTFVRKFGLVLVPVPREVAGGRPGTIVAQSVRPGARVSLRFQVTVYVAVEPKRPDNPARDWVIVPSVLGALRSDAESQLAALGLRTEGTETRTEVARPQTVFGQDPQPGRRVSRATTVRLNVALPPLVTVPDLSGHTRPDAEALIRERRLTASFDEDAESTAEPGLIVRQEPDAGVQVESGAMVRATIALGVVVPNLVTVPATDARARLTAANFRIDERTETSGTAPASTVLRQDPDAGTRVARGSLVALVTAVQPQVQVPVAPAVPPLVPPPVGQPPAGPPPAVQPPVNPGPGTSPVAPTPPGTPTRNEEVLVPVSGPAREPASRWPLWLVAVALVGLVAYRFVRANNVDDKPPSLQPEPEVRSAQPPPPPLQLEPHVGSSRARLETEPSFIAFEVRIRASAGTAHTTASCDGPLVSGERRIYE